ncbi:MULTISPECIES: hypothetical protein [Pseudomonas]|nr:MULTISPECIES: hypothetical protein [Pseudomonas]
MITLASSPSFVQPPRLPTTPLAPVVPPAMGHEDTQPYSPSNARGLPRLRRSTELENPATGDASLIAGQPLSYWQELTGNIQNNYRLVGALQQIHDALVKESNLDITTLLETKKFSVHEYSAFARAYGIEAGDEDSVAWFLRENQLLIPKDIGQLANLIAVLKEPLPEPAEHGNHWGLLSESATLDSEQRKKVSEITQAEMARLSPGKGIFCAFYEQHGASLQGKSAAQVLDSMMGSTQITGLGQTLKTALTVDDASLSTDPSNWAMAAMVLELDPLAGNQRGVVAGYDLYQAANRDVHPSVVVSRLEQHLVEQGKVPAEMAAAAARLLLAGSEPAFIVKGLPDNLTLKSTTFARLSAVVQAQEFWAPGIATHTDFKTFMRLAEHSPVTDTQAAIEAKAQTHALIQWAIAQDKMVQKTDDAYTPEDVAAVYEAFNAQLNALKKAHDQLAATMPTRRDIANKNLTAAYGAGYSFNVRNIKIANIDASESKEHSLEEIYMAGKMNRIPRGERYDFQLGNRFPRVKPLPDVNQQFKSEFDSYFKNMKEGLTTTVKHQLSQLPLEDRQTIASGKVEFFSLRKSSTAEAQGTESADEARAAKARYGLLMRVQTKIDKNGSDQDPKNIRHVYYEVFPLQGVIRRREDLPRHLPNPPPRVANAETYETTQAKGIGIWVDYAAYENGTQARPEQYSDGLLTAPISAPNMPEPRAGQHADAVTDLNPRFDRIAEVVAGHLLHDREAMEAGAKGVTEVEKEEAGIKAGHDFVTGLIPFKNAIENAVKGNTGAAILDFALDIFGFIVPFAKGVGQAGRALSKLSEKLGTRAFKASDSVVRSLAGGLNPADGLGDLVEGLAKGGKSLLKSSYRELQQILHKQSSKVGNPTQVTNAASNGAGTGRQLPDYSEHALPDGFLEGRTIRGDGTYQVGEEFYVRFTDGTGKDRTFQVERHYKGAGKPVRVIDPNSQKQVMMLVPTGNGEWRLAGNAGGGKKTANAESVRLAPQQKPGRKGNPPSPAVVPPGQVLANHHNWQSVLDSGFHNGQPVYIHYTSKEGAEAIARAQGINDLTRNETRAGSKGGVYVNPPGQQLNSENVETLLFLGNERYAGRGEYKVIFSTDQVPRELGPVTAGSSIIELKMDKEIKLTPSNFLYLGPNKFPDYFG